MALVVTPARGGRCIDHEKHAAFAAGGIRRASAIAARIVGDGRRASPRSPMRAEAGRTWRRSASRGGEIVSALPRCYLPELRRDRAAVLYGSCRTGSPRVRSATRFRCEPWLRSGLAALSCVDLESAARVSGLRPRPGTRGASPVEGAQLSPSPARRVERVGAVQAVPLGADSTGGVGVSPYRAITQDRLAAKREGNCSDSI